MGPLSPHSGILDFSVQIALSQPPGACLPPSPRSEVTGRLIPTLEHEDTQAQEQLRGSFCSGGRRVAKSAAAAAKSLQSCPTLCDPIDGRLPRPRDSPGKNTGVGCHCLLQCMKVKSESEAAQSYLTLRDPMDCSLLGSSMHGISQARVLEWGAIAFSSH